MTKTWWAPERQYIDPHEDYELRRFDVPKAEIEAAVKRSALALRTSHRN
jgi:hypothetical protein